MEILVGILLALVAVYFVIEFFKAIFRMISLLLKGIVPLIAFAGILFFAISPKDFLWQYFPQSTLNESVNEHRFIPQTVKEEPIEIRYEREEHQNRSRLRRTSLGQPISWRK